MLYIHTIKCPRTVAPVGESELISVLPALLFGHPLASHTHPRSTPQKHNLILYSTTSSYWPVRWKRGLPQNDTNIHLQPCHVHQSSGSYVKHDKETHSVLVEGTSLQVCSFCQYSANEEKKHKNWPQHTFSILRLLLFSVNCSRGSTHPSSPQSNPPWQF